MAPPPWDLTQPSSSAIGRQAEIQFLITDLVQAQQWKGPLDCWIAISRDWAFAATLFTTILSERMSEPALLAARELTQENWAAAEALVDRILVADRERADPLLVGLYKLTKLEYAQAMPYMQEAWRTLRGSARESNALFGFILGLTAMRRWAETISTLEAEITEGIPGCLARFGASRGLFLASRWLSACCEHLEFDQAEKIAEAVSALLQEPAVVVEEELLPLLRLRLLTLYGWIKASRRNYRNALDNLMQAQEILDVQHPKFAEMPSMIVAQRTILGLRATSLSNIDRWREAEKCYTESTALGARLWALSPRTTLRDYVAGLNNYARFLNEQQRFNDAIPLYRRSIAAVRSLDTDASLHQDFISIAHMNLTESLKDAGDFSAAVQSASETEALMASLYAAEPDQHAARYALMLNNLSALWKDVGKWQEAESTGKRAVQLLRELTAKDARRHEPTLAIALNNLSLVHQRMGDFDAARDAIAESIALSRRLTQVDPEIHRGALALKLNNLAQLRERLGQYDAAKIAYQESLEIHHTLAQVNAYRYQSSFASLLNNMGHFYKSRGQWKEAEGYYEECLALRKKGAGGGLQHSRAETVTILINLSALKHAEGRTAIALGLLHEAIDILRELLPENRDKYGSQLATALGNLATMYSEGARLEEATRIQLDAIDLRLSLRLTDHNKGDLARDYSNLGHAYLRWKKWSMAEESFLHAIRLRRDLYFPNRIAYAEDLANSLDGLARVYLGDHRYHEAENVVVELLRIRREISANPSPENLFSLTQALALAADIARQSANARAEDAFRVEQFRTARRLMHRNQSALAHLAVRAGINLGFERMRHGRLINGTGIVVQGIRLHFKRSAINSAAARTADFENARRRVESLRELAQEDWPANARMLAERLEGFASKLRGLGETGRCIAVQEEAVALYENLLTQGHLQTRLPLINALRRLGDLHSEKFQDIAAEVAYRKLLAQSELDADDISLKPELAKTWEKLSLVHGRAGQSAMALDAQRRAAESWGLWARVLEKEYKRKFEESDHTPTFKPQILPERALSLLRLSYLEENANHGTESLQAAGEAIQISRELWSMGAHRGTEMLARSLRRIAVLQAAKGDLDAAQSSYEEAIQCLRASKYIEVGRKFGIRRRPLAAQSMEDLSLVLLRQRKFAVAAQTIEKAIELRRRITGTQDAALARNWNVLGQIAYSTNDFVRSESAFLKALRFTRNMRGQVVSRGMIRLQSQIGLAKARVGSNKRGEAMKSLLAGKKLLHSLPPHEWQIFRWNELGDAFRDLAEAEMGMECVAEADRVSKVLKSQAHLPTR